MNHNDAREFLRHAAGHDGSNLTMKVMALVQAAAMQSRPQSQNRKENDGTES